MRHKVHSRDHSMDQDDDDMSAEARMYSKENLQDLVPFPIVEEKTDFFDHYVEKMSNDYKYLLSFIAQNCGPDKVDEFSCILANSKSKYASDIWIGQEELYEDLDKVLNKLKNEPKHKCFLQKVTAKEVLIY
eukprot:NODE_405_length_7994_cov_0.788600.p6 type:complete len:132 gc:universal NODE_405_length_7994_cov_0.788600:7721-7326(-)